jgi:uncharacterized coiled-coil DUF342 family protein
MIFQQLFKKHRSRRGQGRIRIFCNLVTFDVTSLLNKPTRRFMDKIKSALHRTTQTVNQKLGKADASVDEEFETMHRNFTNSLTLAESFNKHIQQLNENFNALTAILTFTSEDLNEIYLKSDDPNKKRMTEEIMAVSVEIEKSGVQNFQQQVMANVWNPVNEYILRFAEVKKINKQRADLVKEYDYYRNRVQKMSEQSQKDPLALPKVC